MKQTLATIFLIWSFFFSSLQAAPKTDVKASKAFFNLGSSYFNDFKYPEAVHYFKLAVEKDKNNWLAYEMLGEAYSRLRLVDDALAAYGMSLKIHPHNSWVMIAIQDLQAARASAVSDAGQSTGSLPQADVKNLEVNLELNLPFYSGNTFDRDIWKPDFAFGFEVLREISPAILLGGRFDYFLLRADVEAAAQKYFPGVLAEGTDAGGLMNIMQIMPELKWRLAPTDSVFQPFLKGGAGWMQKSFDGLDFEIPSTLSVVEIGGPVQNSFSFALGAGLPLQINESFSMVFEYEKLTAFGDGGKDDIDLINFGLSMKW